MPSRVTIQVGDKHYALSTDHLPPVGAKITAHSHYLDDSKVPLLQVVDHEWRLEEPGSEDGPIISITIRTRIIG